MYTALHPGHGVPAHGRAAAGWPVLLDQEQAVKFPAPGKLRSTPWYYYRAAILFNMVPPDEAVWEEVVADRALLRAYKDQSCWVTFGLMRTSTTLLIHSSVGRGDVSYNI